MTTPIVPFKKVPKKPPTTAPIAQPVLPATDAPTRQPPAAPPIVPPHAVRNVLSDSWKPSTTAAKGKRIARMVLLYGPRFAQGEHLGRVGGNDLVFGVAGYHLNSHMLKA